MNQKIIVSLRKEEQKKAKGELKVIKEELRTTKVEQLEQTIQQGLNLGYPPCTSNIDGTSGGYWLKDNE